ncbi:MAG: hypothetical protein ACE5EZ_01790 [Thermodesulfobacteriota bacterium]
MGYALLHPSYKSYELVIAELPFIVPYRVKGKEVQILSVYHTSRKWPEVFE